jgi:hypothetical protein
LQVMAGGPFLDARIVPEPPPHLEVEGTIMFHCARSRGASICVTKRIVGLHDT